MHLGRTGALLDKLGHEPNLRVMPTLTVSQIPVGNRSLLRRRIVKSILTAIKVNVSGNVLTIVDLRGARRSHPT